jgi:hypothetical protein
MRRVSMLIVTVALFVKVWDGIVLATDSATTFSKRTLLIREEHQVYNNADKIFHLHRELPIAAMTFGMGTVGPASIASLSKSFRLQLMGRDPNYADSLDVDNYTIQSVAERASKMFAQAAQDAGVTQWPSPPLGQGLGYVVTGMSSDCDKAEAWLLKFEGATLEPQPELVYGPNQYGNKAFAQPEPVDRLFNGYDDALFDALVANEVKAGKTQVQGEQAINTFIANLNLKVNPVQPGMPLPDAIALARFMVETTEGYARFRFGPDTVGGPVEVASISPHEGFKWIQRKHYYDRELNRGEQP